MKKMFPYICTALYSLSFSLFIYSLLSGLGLAISLFADDYRWVYIFWGVACFSFLAFVALLAANVRFFPKTGSVRRIVVVEIIGTGILFFPFWRMWEAVFEALY